MGPSALAEAVTGADDGLEKVVAMIRRSCAAAAVGLLIAMAACGGGESDVAPTAAVATPEEAEASASGLFPAGEPVDLVVLSDSGGFGVAELYATTAEQALDREIRVHDFSRGGATAPEILWGIQNRWTTDVADAEIIVFYVHPGGFEPPGFVPCLDALDAETWDPPAAISVEDWQGYRDALDRIYDEIWTLRAAQPTILRAYGVWGPWLSQWQQMGIDAECMGLHDLILKAIRMPGAIQPG